MGNEFVSMRTCGVIHALSFFTACVFVILVTRQLNCGTVSTENAVVYWFVQLFDKRPVGPLRGKEVSSSWPDLLRSILLGFPEVDPIHLVSLLHVFHMFKGERMSLVLCFATLSDKIK
jgi:hypothetical protein